MGRYDSHKHPFQYRMNQWAGKRINDRVQREAKSMPCHVTKVDKDFIYVQFENQNNIFQLPTVKIPQSWSQYSREPTQKGDKGYAVPGNFYLGGVTGDAGGNTDFYPRGNLTTLSFNGTSHKQNPDRDYDQLTHMGGPNGWIVGTYQKQQQDQQGQQGQQGGSSPSLGGFGSFGTAAFNREQRKLRAHLSKNAPELLVGPSIPPISGSLGGFGGDTGQQQQQQQKDPTQFSFDKNGKCLVQSKDDKHNVTVDQQSKTVSMTSSQTIFLDPNQGKVYLGTKKGGSRVMTEDGPSKNVYALV